MQKFYIYSLRAWVSSKYRGNDRDHYVAIQPSNNSIGHLKAGLVSGRGSVESIPCVRGGWLSGPVLNDQSLASRWSVTRRESSRRW